MPQGNINKKSVPVRRDLRMHESVGSIQEEEYIQKIQYFTEFKQLNDIFIHREDQQEKTRGIGSPA
jgi:hypothetical protein